MVAVYRSGLLTGLAIGYLATVTLLAPAGAVGPRSELPALVTSIQDAAGAALATDWDWTAE